MFTANCAAHFFWFNRVGVMIQCCTFMVLSLTYFSQTMICWNIYYFYFTFLPFFWPTPHKRLKRCISVQARAQLYSLKFKYHSASDEISHLHIWLGRMANGTPNDIMSSCLWKYSIECIQNQFWAKRTTWAMCECVCVCVIVWFAYPPKWKKSI